MHKDTTQDLQGASPFERPPNRVPKGAPSIQAHVFVVDDCLDSGYLNFDLSDGARAANYDGTNVNIRELGAVWWRRANQNQKATPDLDSETHQFISSEWKFGLGSVWQSEFSGKWVNSPGADQRATSKTFQLRIAR